MLPAVLSCFDSGSAAFRKALRLLLLLRVVLDTLSHLPAGCVGTASNICTYSISAVPHAQPAPNTLAGAAMSCARVALLDTCVVDEARLVSDTNPSGFARGRAYVGSSLFGCALENVRREREKIGKKKK